MNMLFVTRCILQLLSLGLRSGCCDSLLMLMASHSLLVLVLVVLVHRMGMLVRRVPRLKRRKGKLLLLRIELL